MKLSIICASNSEKILKECLMESLDKQTFKDFEIIVVDANKEGLTGAAEALNFGAKKAKSEYLMFVHHDVLFGDKNSLSNIIIEIDKLGDFGVAGIAGVTNNEHELVGNIVDGEDKRPIANSQIDHPMEVFSLDEVCFIVKRDFFENNKLDEENKTWHLYAVEYCLKMHDKGERVYVLPTDGIWHKSRGKMNEFYFDEIKRVVRTYKKKLIGLIRQSMIGIRTQFYLECRL